MKIKLLFLIALFFLNKSFFVNGMEIDEITKEDLKQRRRGEIQQKDGDISLPMSRIKEDIQDMTHSGVTSRSDGKYTPRNIGEIQSLVRIYSNKVTNQRSPKRIRITQPRDIGPIKIQDPIITQDPIIQDSVIIQEPAIKSTTITEKENISEEIDINKLAKELAEKIHIEPSVLADTILKLHGEKDKAPLIEETKGYEKMYEKNENEYKDLVIELFKMVLLNEEESETSAESGKIVDTHVGLLRNAVDEHRSTIEHKNKTIAKKTFLLYVTRIVAIIATTVSTGLAIWAAYAQSQSGSCTNSTAT